MTDSPGLGRQPESKTMTATVRLALGTLAPWCRRFLRGLVHVLLHHLDEEFMPPNVGREFGLQPRM
jgi:hypothetical protein